MQDKIWYKSKTIYAALGVVVIAVLQALGYGEYSEILYAGAGAFGIYGIRDAVGKLK